MRHFSKFALWIPLICLSIFAAGCEEDDDDDDQTVTQSVSFVYSANFSDSIDGFLMNPETGELSEMPGSPFPASTPQDLALLDEGRIMAIRSNFNVGLKEVDSETGRLVTVPGSATSSSAMAGNMVCAAAAGFCFVGETSSQNIYRHQLDLENEELVTLTPNYTTGGPNTPRIAFDEAGGFLYVATSGSGDVLSLTLDTDTGVLSSTPSGSVTLGGTLSNLAVDPQGEFLAVFDVTQVHLLSIEADGDLAFESTEPHPTSAVRMAFHPTEDLLYTIGNGGIRVYTLDRDDMTLTAVGGSPFDAGSSPLGLAFSADGNYLLVGDQSDAILQVFEIGENGAPEEIDGSPYDVGGAATSITTLAPASE